MARSVQMPPLGESVTEGTVSRWLKKVGDRVEVDDPLVEVTTDKVDTEIPSPFAGTLERIVVAEDETAEVGAELALIADGAGTAPEVVSTPEAPDAARAPDTVAEEITPQEITPHDDPPVAAPDATAATASVDITMPALGESVTEGTVTRWLVSVGDTVSVDQPLLEVSTDKVDTEVPSPVAGTITAITATEDETVAVGAVLATVGGSAAGADVPPVATPAPDREDGPADVPKTQSGPTPDDQVEPVAAALEEITGERVATEGLTGTAAAQEAEGAAAAERSGPAAVEPVQAAVPASRPPAGAEVGAYVTPIVRKLAAELGVDLSSMSGTGVGGRIRRQDITAAAEAAAAQAADEAAAARAADHAAATVVPTPAAPSPGTADPSRPALRGTTKPLSRTRKVIAARMMSSLQMSAQLTTVVEVDVTRVARLRSRSKAAFEAREGVKLSFLPFFALAVVEALKAHPVLNASTDGESITYHGSENLGIAVDTERGLMVPVISDAGELNLAGLARRIADLAERTRARKVGPDDLSGSTFTLTNTGSRGALFDTPILNQPEVGILGTGAVVKRPVVVTDADGGESIAVRSMVYLALSYDHRIVDGADAARFLVTLKSRLEAGAFESDLGI